jgi:hypothetical protein
MVCVGEQLGDAVGRERVVVTADCSVSIHQDETRAVDRTASWFLARRNRELESVTR